MSEVNKAELERVMRKIRNCLALSASANEHEAAAAMRQAQKLMKKYRLTELDISISDVGKVDGGPVCAKRPKWDLFLSEAVATAFGCQTYVRTVHFEAGYKKRQRAMFVGVSPAQDIAKYAYDTLHRALKKARADYLTMIKAGRAPAGKYSPATRANHFAEAWVYEVQKKLAALVPEADDPTMSDEKALAVSSHQQNELITAFMRGLMGGKDVPMQKTRKGVRPGFADQLAGRLAGQMAQLHHGVGTAGDELLALGGAC